MNFKSPESIESPPSKTELLFQALGGEAVQVQCTECKAVEFVIPLDLVLDEAFLANYLCDDCEETGAPQ